MTATKLGIWMDHSHAHVTEFTDTMTTSTIESKFTHSAKEESLHKGENHMHVKERHQQGEYYKKLGELIRNYQEVLLFGPTDAKTELLNTLHGNHLFADIKIEVINADKMSNSQEHAFVKKHFARH